MEKYAKYKSSNKWSSGGCNEVTSYESKNNTGVIIFSIIFIVIAIIAIVGYTSIIGY